MTVVGFAFTKLLAEKKKRVKGKLQIANNIAIKNVKGIPLQLADSNVKQSGLKFSFQFSSKYEPDIGNITLEGDVLFMGEKAQNEKIVKSWKKDKKIPNEVVTQIVNIALTRCNIEALLLSKEISLPPPIKLPSIGEKVKGREYIG